MNAKKLLAEWSNKTHSDLSDLAQEIWGFLPENAFVAVQGEMGAGKTTTISSLIHAAQIEHFEGSPTFAIVQSYVSTSKGKIFHLDCYRIENETELLNLGLEELFEQKAVFFVEWSEKIKQILPLQHFWLYIRTNPDLSRTLELYHDN
jgi:tRNA threonylcarbamoyladenosine biosynthesis protein TsaE